MRNFIRCVNVNYQSVRDEEFYDIQLDVKVCGLNAASALNFHSLGLQERL